LMFGFLRLSRNGQKNMHPEIKRIFALREALINVGYNPSEVDYMIATLSGRQDLRTLDAAALEKLETALEKQLSVAQDCIDSIHKTGRQPVSPTSASDQHYAYYGDSSNNNHNL